ncbi:MAG TPA: hypothetical protein VIM12_19615 [Noviherbaspirillum sp.]|uniref:hypothetical protein n=1 Tax=Noviherbaspirillum sp. TaxID=1926288 RepID=UPI002F936D16
MSHPEILIPFGLPPAELAGDMLRQLPAPSLATMLSRAHRDVVGVKSDAPFQRALPHERWLASRVGIADAGAANSSPPVARLLLDTYCKEAPRGTWFVLQPVHIHVARDHLVLTDPRQLALGDEEARVLFALARPLFEEHGLDAVYGDAQTWFLRADAWTDMDTATPDAAAGHNIDIWMPRGTHERAWRKVQNEVQMHWFTHPLNAAREARGLKPVNSLWLWAGASPNQPAPGVPFTHACNLDGWAAAFRRCAGASVHARSASMLPSDGAGNMLILVDALVPHYLSADWGSWLARVQELEEAWFGPLLEGVKSGVHERLSILLSDDNHLLEFTLTRPALRKFWRKPSLAPLVP